MSQPSYKYTRAMAFAAFVHFVVISFRPETNDIYAQIDLLIILIWAVGSNGREALVDAVKAWASRGQ